MKGKSGQELVDKDDLITWESCSSPEEVAMFNAWMSKVDAHIANVCGFTSEDLPDCCYADWFEDGITPSRAAKKAIRFAKGGNRY